MFYYCALWLAVGVADTFATDNLHFPRVNNAVSSMIREYQYYATYAGPTGTIILPMNLKGR